MATQSSTAHMRTENMLMSRINNFNSISIPNADRSYKHYTEAQIKAQNVYSSIQGEDVKFGRLTNDVYCFHPTQRVPFNNPEYLGSW